MFIHSFSHLLAFKFIQSFNYLRAVGQDVWSSHPDPRPSDESEQMGLIDTCWFFVSHLDRPRKVDIGPDNVLQLVTDLVDVPVIGMRADVG